MSRRTKLVVLSASILSQASVALGKELPSPLEDFNIGSSLTLSSDYIWRGQSQADKPVVQGGLDLSHKSGLYLSVWGSEVDDEVFSGANTEVDYYAGYTYTVSPKVHINFQYSKYTYVGASEWNTSDVAASISAYGVTLGKKYNTQGGEHPSYAWMGYKHALPYGAKIFSTYGHTDQKSGWDDYNDWSIGFSKEIFGLNASITYTDTNITANDCQFVYNSASACSNRFTVAITKIFN